MPASDALEESLAELYLTLPEAFIAERDKLAASVLAAGDEVGAARVKRLDRPSISGYWVNQVAARWPGELTELLDLGPQLRAASTAKDRKRLTEIDRIRRLRTDALLSLLWHHGEDEVLAGRRRPSTETLTRVLETLTAAVLDEDVARVVRTGRVTKATALEGFDILPFDDEPVIERGLRVARLPESSSGQSDPVTVASAAVVDAENRVSAAADTVASLTGMLESLEHELTELTRDRDNTRARMEAWSREVKEAERELRMARRRLDSLTTPE